MADELQTITIPPVLAERGYRFVHSFRVRYRDIDRQGIVFHGNYISYLDYGITEYMRALGFSWREMEQDGFDMAVVRSVQDFRAPARLDDLLCVGVRTLDIGETSFTVQFTIWGEDAITGQGQVILEAQQVYVNYDPETGAARPVPGAVRRAVRTFEGGGEASHQAPA